MAALLPGADGAFTVVEHKGDAVPAVGGIPLPGLAERHALLHTRYGDRLVDITLEDLRATSQTALAKKIGVADLLVVRTQDIDELGEGISMHRARRTMTEVLRELRGAATRLANLGFQTLVFAADHGHMLLPEVAAGDALSTQAQIDVEYRPELDDEGKTKRGSPFHIAELRPIQLARFDFEEYCEGRRAFSTEQWMDALVRSAGMEPDRMEHRLKLLFIARFLPFVEKNFNFIELGPRGTGKSYVFSEMSPYCILVSGGKASSANLFYNNARRTVGLVGHWDTVAFDEVGGMKVQDPDTVQIMKDYMANGRFSRGITQVLADASLAFIGNLNQSVETLVQNAGTDLFQPLPREFDLAILDRLHFYLPGWEIPKNSRDLLTIRYGFVTDYLSEAFRTLRKQNRFDAIDAHYRLGSNVEGRDATAVRRTVSGLLKLLHPDGSFTKPELQQYLELALEGRRRIKEQLKKRGSFEFYKTSFSYIDLEDGMERAVGVPEQGGRGVISADPLPPGTVYTAAIDDEGRLSLYRLEVTVTAGTGKLRTPAGLERGLKESLNRAWAYLQSVRDRMGLFEALAQKDVVAEAIDLSGGRVECACGVAFFVAMLSVIGNRKVQAGTVVLGDLTIQGNV
ncbi:MAG TPA: BREX system Lon protease-like protein BrxL, partial [Chloroflexota bacterium]|nr:BREX system Lon protease-like protein BrxL [Chloroflexota bacterium]